MPFSFGSALTQGLTGAGAGAGFGSLFGPVGTAVGAGLGGLTGFLGSFFDQRRQDGIQQRQAMIQDQGINQQMMNLPGDIGQVTRQQTPEGTLLGFPLFTPQQQQQQQQLSQVAMGGLGGLFQPPQGIAQSGAQEADSLRSFREQTVPAIAERFSGPGSAGQRSSAFRQSLGAAGAGLEERLAMIREDRDRFNLRRLDQRSALQASLIPQLLQFGQRPQFDQQLVPQDEGFFRSSAPGLGQVAGMLLPLLLEAGGRAAFNRIFRGSATGAGGTGVGGTATGGTGVV